MSGHLHRCPIWHQDRVATRGERFRRVLRSYRPVVGLLRRGRSPRDLNGRRLWVFVAVCFQLRERQPGIEQFPCEQTVSRRFISSRCHLLLKINELDES